MFEFAVSDFSSFKQNITLPVHPSGFFVSHYNLKATEQRSGLPVRRWRILTCQCNSSLNFQVCWAPGPSPSRRPPGSGGAAAAARPGAGSAIFAAAAAPGTGRPSSRQVSSCRIVQPELHRDSDRATVTQAGNVSHRHGGTALPVPGSRRPGPGRASDRPRSH